MSRRTRASRKAARRRYYIAAWAERRQPDPPPVPPVLRSLFDAIARAFTQLAKAAQAFVAQMRGRGHLPCRTLGAAQPPPPLTPSPTSA